MLFLDGISLIEKCLILLRVKLIAKIVYYEIDVTLVPVIFQLVYLISVGDMRQKHGRAGNACVIGNSVKDLLHFLIGLLVFIPFFTVGLKIWQHADHIQTEASRSAYTYDGLSLRSLHVGKIHDRDVYKESDNAEMVLEIDIILILIVGKQIHQNRSYQQVT